MSGDQETEQAVKPWLEIKEEYRAEIERYQKEIHANSTVIEQSNLELQKLAQRNASIMANLHQVQTQLDSLSRADIRKTYEAALETQQRLFVMRGQIEKLQSDQLQMKRYVNTVETILKHADNNDIRAGSAKLTSMNARTIELLIQAQEAERLRLSRQMHDGPAQSFSNFILQTDIALRLFDMDVAKAREELINLKGSATTSFQQVRDFIFELRPMMLDDLGLIPTLKRYIDWFRDQTGLEIRLTFSGSDRRLASYQEVVIFRAIQELMNNVSRHALASEVKINIDLGDQLAKVMVGDNGKGFNPQELENQTGMGLHVIRERVETLGGSMDIDSEAGHGSRINFQIPAEIITSTSTSILGLK